MSIQKADEDIKKIIRRNGVRFKYKLTFPIYNVLPEEVRLALKVLEKHGMHIAIELEEEK